MEKNVAQNPLIPISDEQAKVGQEVVKALGGLGSFVERVLGTVPEDLVGYLGGDWLRFSRIENLVKLMARTKERLEMAGIQPKTSPSLSLLLPILRAAADESREELQDLWSRLLAAALDPSKAPFMRQGYTEVLGKLDPWDAAVLTFFHKKPILGLPLGTTRMEQVAAEVSATVKVDVPTEEVTISLWNLEKLGLVVGPPGRLCWETPPFGKKFIELVMAEEDAIRQ